MKELLAVDVALPLPNRTDKLCKRINARLLQTDPTGFAFDQTHFPHITLVQQFVAKSSLSALCGEIERVLKDRPPLRLQAQKTVFVGAMTLLRIKNSPVLRELHNDLVNALAGLAESGGDSSTFFLQGPTLLTWEIGWVTAYRDAASFDNYDPHVTLGVGRSDVSIQPFSFTADRVGLYHLGRFCTCRHLFERWKLKPRAVKGTST